MMGSAALLCVVSLLPAVDGIALDNDSIRVAVAAWLSDATTAEATYGHISTWETGGVTDMFALFCDSDLSNTICYRSGARKFNEDIGAWDTSSVTRMTSMFSSTAFNEDMNAWVSAFNQDIGGWAVHSVTDMRSMFSGATAFDQDLGWCVGHEVDLYNAFVGGTVCASTSCGIKQGICDYPMTDINIRTAVAEWLSDSAAAEAAYGHISTWETSGVTDMESLFDIDYNSGAASFNEDISAWDVSGATSMKWMFWKASAFDQDLDWCVDDDVVLSSAFYNAKCASTYCGVKWETNTGDCDMSRTGNVMVNWKIRWAVNAWLSNATAAEATYGHISTWETGGVTDMEELFKFEGSFNEDIGAWDTSGVTTMYLMFYYASAFNQDIGAWGTSGVTRMEYMFAYASSFNQDISGWAVDNVKNMGAMFYRVLAFDQELGWCVGDVSLSDAFVDTLCEETSCGVIQGTCAPTPAPTVTPAGTSSSSGGSRGGGAIGVIAGVAAAAALLLVVGAFWSYRRRTASMMDKADEPSSPPKFNPEPTELPPPDEESLETRAAAKAKAAETAERPGLARKLSSFLFGEQEEEPTALAVAEAEEAPSAEQLPPPTPAEPAAPKAEEMYNQIAAWYSEPDNAALRTTWGAYPEPEDFQTWPGFVAVTNAFLDREAG